MLIFFKFNFGWSNSNYSAGVKFSIRNFAKKYNMGQQPWAGNFFQAQNQKLPG